MDNKNDIMRREASNLLLKVRVDSHADAFAAIEGSIRDEFIPVSLGKSAGHPEMQETLGSQHSLTMMNKEYLRLKLGAAKWLRTRDFLIDTTVPLHNGIFLRAYTVPDTVLEDEARELHVEVRRDWFSPACYEAEAGRLRKRRLEDSLDEANPNDSDGI
jgi:hypothetical protein